MAEQDPRYRELSAIFDAEIEERVPALNRLLLSLERGEGDEASRAETFDALLQECHSLKAAARSADLSYIERLAHALESALGSARRSKARPSKSWFDDVFGAVDAFSTLYHTARRGEDSLPPELDGLLAILERTRAVSPAAREASPPPGPLNRLLSSVSASSAPTAPPDVTPETPGTGRPLPGPVDGVSVARSAGSPPEGEAPAAPPRGQPAAPQEPRSSTSGGPTTPASPVETAARPTQESVRVAVSKLDVLMSQAGELAVTNVRIEQRLSELVELRNSLDNWRRGWRVTRGVRTGLRRVCDSPEAAESGLGRDLSALLLFAEQAEQRTQAVLQRVDEIAGQLRRDTAQLGFVTHTIADEVMAVRLLPVSTVFGPFERMVRDLTRSQGKEVHLVVEGEDIEIDRKILEQLRDPLMHMIRNAVDHGIEPPEERQPLGKPRMGTLRLSASQRGGVIDIEVEDDGRGLDPDLLRQSAVRKGLLSEEQAAALDDRSAFELIYHPGFSTRAKVTETSGRGVGMDVVRLNVERLNGSVSVTSSPGSGTSFTISVPLTLATTRVILVEQGEELFAIPSSMIERNSRVQERQLVSLEGCRAVRIEGHPVPIMELAEVLDRSRINHADRSVLLWRPFFVLSQGDRRVALLADRLVGEQEIVVKSLSWPLRRVRNVAGAAVLGSGQTVVILNPSDLLKTALKLVGSGARLSSRESGSLPVERPKQRLLVVDDSLTTRTLVRSILMSAGYEVSVAADGVEALGVLRGQPPVDLIVSDVEMPCMDGFSLTAEVRRDEKLSRIPVVLVTSLDSREHRERGASAGADAYVVKTGFDQSELLETVNRLL